MGLFGTIGPGLIPQCERLCGDFRAGFAPLLAYCDAEDIHPALK